MNRSCPETPFGLSVFWLAIVPNPMQIRGSWRSRGLGTAPHAVMTYCQDTHKELLAAQSIETLPEETNFMRSFRNTKGRSQQHSLCALGSLVSRRTPKFTRRSLILSPYFAARGRWKFPMVRKPVQNVPIKKFIRQFFICYCVVVFCCRQPCRRVLSETIMLVGNHYMVPGRGLARDNT